MKALLKAVFIAALSTAAVTSAYGQDESASASASANSPDAVSSGEIRKVDKSAGKLTIKHGELRNVGMPAMTMVFKVKDPSMLGAVKAGDKVNFIVEKAGSEFIVTKLQAQK
jgi:Cu(I)/Ag(I) efflux system periplasmic protein CusF